MDLNRRDAETQRDEDKSFVLSSPFSPSPLLLFFALCLCVSAVNLSCGSKPTDLRTLVPADTLVYLETNDLAAALQPIVDSKPFTEAAKKKPDFSALRGVQLAVAVMGFETSEEKLTDESSVGRVQPRFVAVADTHAWNYQAVAFAEQKLGGFVTTIYDSEPKVEKTDAKGGKYFIWSAADGRKAYALVIDSYIYFSNDESAIDKCLAVRRGEADSIAKAGKVQPTAQGTLASGYVSPDGVAQIANIVGLKFAAEVSDESEVRSAVVSILPQLIRGSVTDLTWTQRENDHALEDTYQINMPAEVANIFSETLAASTQPDQGLEKFVPTEFESVTKYQFKDAQVAWRSVVITLGRDMDPLGRKVFELVTTTLFEPYGVSDVEMFLRSAGSEVLTIKKGPDDENVAVIVKGEVAKALSKELDVSKSPESITGGSLWKTSDDDLAAAAINSVWIVGNTETVNACAQASTPEATRNAVFPNSNAPVQTIGTESQLALRLVNVLAQEGHGETRAGSRYVTETRFNKSGMERQTVSDFGLIGSIIAMLDED